MPYSLLQQLRMKYQPNTPDIFKNFESLTFVPADQKAPVVSNEIKALFPHISYPPLLKLANTSHPQKHLPKRVGVVLSGGQAAGGHNVIAGLFDALKKLHPESKLFGFKNGPKGIVDNKYIEITDSILSSYRNQGGFDLIGSGRTKIETPEQFDSAEKTVRRLQLDGLIIIGGDDSNTNAALLAEYFLSKNCNASVIGVPKTIDGDLKGNEVEISFGFDSACKTYSEIIGNIARDTLSAKKSYYFIKLMGRSASHIALECALQTHPNMAFIGEEVAAQKKTLQQLTNELCNMIVLRSAKEKEYGVILIPEGIIEFIPEFKQLISELNTLVVNSIGSPATEIIDQLSPQAKICLNSIPKEIQTQMLMDRDPHGNVQVSKIETERLFIEMVRLELSRRRDAGEYSGSFNSQPYFCGYEGRSCLPTNFDADYCYCLGQAAALLVKNNVTGYMCAIKNLAKPVNEWEIGACCLITMMDMELRHGKKKPVIQKALVDLQGAPFVKFQDQRESWILNDDYCYPGPIQFFGPRELIDQVTITLRLESEKSLKK